MSESSPAEPESFVVIPSPSPATAQDPPSAASEVAPPDTSSSDTSFEEVRGQDCVEDKPEEVGDNCNDNVRQVLDDVEAQIERLREAVTRLAEDKRGLLEVLEGVSQSVPETPLTAVEAEEVVLEVERLRGRVEEVMCGLETRRTNTQKESLLAVEAEISALVSLVETDPDGDRVSKTCRGYLAACGGPPSGHEGPAISCHKFEKIVLGCAVEDQKMIRKRLTDLLSQIEIIADHNCPSV